MGFISDLLGTSNKFKATGADLTGQTTDYQAAIQKALGGLTGSGSSQAQQQQLMQQLFQNAQGNGPSAAQGQLQAATDQNINGLAGQVAGMRGLNPGVAARAVLENSAQAQQQAANQSALLKVQEQQNAYQNLGNVVDSARSADVNTANALGGLQNSQNSIATQNALGTQGINSGVAQQNAAQAGNILGGIAGAGATFLGLGNTGTAGAGSAATAMKAHGGKIEGKATVPGDSYENDTVPAVLSPGEIVLPRTVAHDPQKSKEFVEHLTKSKGGKSGEPEGYGKVVSALKRIEDRIKKLEK